MLYYIPIDSTVDVFCHCWALASGRAGCVVGLIWRRQDRTSQPQRAQHKRVTVTPPTNRMSNTHTHARMYARTCSRKFRPPHQAAVVSVGVVGTRTHDLCGPGVSAQSHLQGDRLHSCWPAGITALEHRKRNVNPIEAEHGLPSVL